MNIVQKLDPVVVTGPRVAVLLEDTGKAQVHIALSIGDGAMFVYKGGDTDPSNSLFPPGQYECAAVISAFNQGAFGGQYKSVIKIGGQTVATAKGTVAKGGVDSGATAFLLVVQ